MDAFFVSVELRRRPELRGQPVVVGGTGRRGVVAAASYEARRYGVHSAMPSARARRLCPHAVFLPGDHAAYADGQRARCTTSSRVHPARRAAGARRGVPRRHRGAGPCSATASTIARRIRAEVARRARPDVLGRRGAEQVPRQAGVGRGQAARRRPRACDPGPACSRSRPGEELAFLHPLPVRRLWGVGPATLERLAPARRRHRRRPRRVSTGGRDRAALGQAHGRAPRSTSPRGIDDRPVEPERAVEVDRPRGDLRPRPPRPRRPAPRAGPPGRRRRRPAAGQRDWRPGRHAQGARRRFRTITRATHAAAGRSTPADGDRRGRLRRCSTRSTRPAASACSASPRRSSPSRPSSCSSTTSAARPTATDDRATPAGRSTASAAGSARRRSVRRAPCRRPGCGSCVAAQQQWGPDDAERRRPNGPVRRD